MFSVSEEDRNGTTLLPEVSSPAEGDRVKQCDVFVVGGYYNSEKLIIIGILTGQ